MSPEAQPGQPKRHLSWEQFTALEALLVEKISRCARMKGIEQFDLIIGIFRGGMIVARSISSRLGDVPLAIVKVLQEDNPRLDWMADARCLDALNGSKSTLNVLIVDDIADSGSTFSKIIEMVGMMHFKTITTASLVTRQGSSFIPDCYAELEVTDKWLVFPWE